MTKPPSQTLITLIGGSGFVGRHVASSLAKQGYRLRIACRRPDLAVHTQPAGLPGQIVPVQANVRYPASLEAAMANADIVINLVGIMRETRWQKFDDVHVVGAQAVAYAAKAAKVPVLIHISSLGSDAQSPSAYARSKALGEAQVCASFPNALIIRPGLIFGPEDMFFNYFAKLARFSPILPLIGGGKTLFEPSFVVDIALAITKLCAMSMMGQQTSTLPYELGGPEIYSFKELISYILEVTGRQKLLVPIPWSVARFIALLTGWLPSAPLTLDQINLLQYSHNLVSPQAKAQERDFKALGITPRALSAVIPTYLYRFRKAGQFTTPKGTAE